MAKAANQKLKLLYLSRILLERTDALHVMSVPDLIAALAEYEIRAERKSIYDDIEALRLYGLDIERRSERPSGYYIASRSFEMPELKLLVDAVQSSKFITHKKSAELISKIESLASVYEARDLQRQVYVSGRIKAMNESIYYNVDKIHAAISEDRQITFTYFEWTVEKKRQLRRGGALYTVSPYALIWDDENYYLLAFDAPADQIKHYRVDKMMHIEMGQAARAGQQVFARLDMASYTKRVFGMFGGNIEQVKIEFTDRLAGVVIDRFGKDIYMRKTDEHHFLIVAEVEVSPLFLSWVLGFGREAKILSPPQLAAQLVRQLEETAALYRDETAKEDHTHAPA